MKRKQNLSFFLKTAKKFQSFKRTRGESTPQEDCRRVCSDADKAWERECGRGWNRQIGQDDTACGWEICEWEVTGHTHQQEPLWGIMTPHFRQCSDRRPPHPNDTHQHIDRFLYTYITSYLAQAIKHLETAIQRSVSGAHTLDTLVALRSRVLSRSFDKRAGCIRQRERCRDIYVPRMLAASTPDVADGLSCVSILIYETYW